MLPLHHTQVFSGSQLHIFDPCGQFLFTAESNAAGGGSGGGADDKGGAEEGEEGNNPMLAAAAPPTKLTSVKAPTPVARRYALDGENLFTRSVLNWSAPTAIQ